MTRSVIARSSHAPLWGQDIEQLRSGRFALVHGGGAYYSGMTTVSAHGDTAGTATGA